MTRWKRHLFGLLLSGLVFWGALEAVLRLAPGLVGPPLANWVYTRYGNFYGGIYFHEPVTDMNFHRPGFVVENYFNGYRWRHATDARGFRNPPDVDTGWLLLGDSMIYGHGVEEAQTVSARLREDFGHPAYNMGRQGACLYQQYVFLRLYLDDLDPDRVVLFVFANDVDDLLGYRTAEELRNLPERDYDYEALRRRIADPGMQRDVPVRQLPYLSKVLRLLRGLVHELALASWVATAEAADAVDGEPLPYVQTILDDERFEAAAGYYRRLLPELDRRAGDLGATLHVVLLDVGDLLGPGGVEAQDRLDRLLREVTQTSEIPYAHTRPLFAECADCFLPGDGHLSPEGHRRLAGLLDGAIR